MAELRKLGDILNPAEGNMLDSHRPTLRNPDDMPPPPSAGASRRGVPLGRMGDTFESFRRAPEMEAAYLQCLAVAEKRARCALLQGLFGNGKTHLAVAAMQPLNEFSTGWFWKVPEFLQSIKTRAFDGDESVDDVIRPYQQGTALFVFDDLGAENRTEWAGEQLFRVLDARYDSKAPTIITTNVALSQLDGRILSRYREGLVICEGEDRR